MGKRWVVVGIALLSVAGCAREEGAREVPVSAARSAAPAGSGDAPTRPPRAIATH